MARCIHSRLFVSGLSIPGRGTHNVVFVSTMHNSVYAFDADAMSPVSVLWQVNLGPSVPAALLFGQYGDIGNEVGILSTGVDRPRSARVLYVVSDVLQGGRPVFYLHALDLASGAERLNGPVALTASVSGTGSGALADGSLPFDSRAEYPAPRFASGQQLGLRRLRFPWRPVSFPRLVTQLRRIGLDSASWACT